MATTAQAILGSFLSAPLLATSAAKAAHGNPPHTLVMTATPIPRTLALTLYGDLDLSVIDELPPGRSKTTTHLFRAGEGESVAKLLRDATARGEQVYVVYPLVAESEKIDLRAASESAEKIRAAFPQLAVDLVHGQPAQGPSSTLSLNLTECPLSDLAENAAYSSYQQPRVSLTLYNS